MHTLFVLYDLPFPQPAVTYGPPISIDWTPLPLPEGQSATATTSTDTEEIYGVEEYERIRPRRKATYPRPGHRGPQNLFLTLSQVQREALLARLQVDKKDIRAALREVNRIKRNRWASIKWYFHPSRTVGELPSNFYMIFRSCQVERQRKRFLREYERSKAVQQSSE